MAKQIDPIYKAYTARIIKYLASTEFYDYFMALLEGGKNTLQFSNRKVEKSVDEAWVTAIEAVIKPMEEIIANPRNFIVQEEAIVNIALAKKVTPDSIIHLAQHGNMIDTVTDDGVRPNRLMNKFKEDTLNTYENRFIYTLLEMAWSFVDKRYEAIFASLNEEYGAYLKMSSQLQSYNENVTANIDLRIRQEEDLLSADEKNESIFSKIARLHRLLSNFRQSNFAQEVAKYGKIKPPLVRTNVIAKNPNFKACHRLWNFLLAYEDVGYNINVYEQSSEIDEAFTRDIYHSILFNYIILKNYLEDPKDREIDLNKNYKKKKLKPRFITEIVEEFVKNYDLPDVEIRKVLIEEVTKAQLMLEEEAERRRLVEEKEKEMLLKKRREEQEQARLAKEAEKERIRGEKEAMRERIRQEKEREAELERLEREKRLKEQSDMQKAVSFHEELEKMKADRAAFVEKSRMAAEEEAKRAAEEQKRRLEEQEAARKKAELEAKLQEERLRREKEKEADKKNIELQRKKAKEKARIALAKKKERERIAQAKKLEAEKAKEKERLALEKAKEKAAKEKAALAEKERIAREKAREKEKAAKERAALAEKERIAREKIREKERAAKEKAALTEKERLAREVAKASEKAAREKAALAEKERLARERAKEKEKAAKARTAKGKAAKTAPTPAAGGSPEPAGPVPAEAAAIDVAAAAVPAVIPEIAGRNADIETAPELLAAVGKGETPSGEAPGEAAALSGDAKTASSGGEEVPASPEADRRDAGEPGEPEGGKPKQGAKRRGLGGFLSQLLGFKDE